LQLLYKELEQGVCDLLKDTYVYLLRQRKTMQELDHENYEHSQYATMVLAE